MQVGSNEEEEVTSAPLFTHDDKVCYLPVDSGLKSRQHKLLLTSIFLLHPPPSYSSSCLPWIITSVEEADGTTQLKHPLSEKAFWDDPSITKLFNLAKFNPATLATVHNISTLKYSRSYTVFDKVVVTSTSLSSVSFGDCTVLALHYGGKLFACPPFDKDDPKVVQLPWIRISCCKDLVFDDIIIYKEMVCAVDRDGLLYEIDYKKGKPHVGKTLVKYSLSGVSGKSHWRKHLVVSPDGKLNMVVKTKPRVLIVYQLVKHSKMYYWHRVTDFEGQVLFISRDYCFFTEVSVFPSCQLRDCVVFNLEAFPRCRHNEWHFGFSDNHHLWNLDNKNACDYAIFKLNGNGVLSWVGQYVGVPEMNWSPPSWFFHSAQSETQPKFQFGRNTLRNSQADDKMQADLHNHDEEHEKMQSNPGKQDNIQDIQMDSSIKKCEKEIISPSIVHDKPITEPTLATPRTNKRTLSITNDAKEASPTGISGKKMRPSFDESKRIDTIVTFQGLNVKSSLIPTLENIWSKHGNILEKCTIRNADVIAVVLESLVNMVNILEDNSVISLADSQVKYLSDTLSDVRSMGFEVEWLVPFAEKAIEVHQNKQQLAILKKLGQIKAQTEERKTKLVEELMKIEGLLRGFEEDMTDLSIKICSGKIDLYQPAGAGL